MLTNLRFLKTEELRTKLRDLEARCKSLDFEKQKLGAQKHTESQAKSKAEEEVVQLKQSLQSFESSRNSWHQASLIKAEVQLTIALKTHNIIARLCHISILVNLHFCMSSHVHYWYIFVSQCDNSYPIVGIICWHSEPHNPTDLSSQQTPVL